MTTSNPTTNPPAQYPAQWEIWQVNWHHYDDGTSKPRPVLILSSTAHNATGNDIWAAKFTGTLDPHADDRIEFNKNDPSFTKTGLTKTCHLYLRKVRPIVQSDLLYKRRPGGPLSGFNAILITIAMKKLMPGVHIP